MALYFCKFISALKTDLFYNENNRQAIGFAKMEG